MKTEIVHQETRTEKFVKWGNYFSGCDTKLIIVKYPTWSEISLQGAGRDEIHAPMCNVPIEVLKEIIKIHDELPK